MSYIPELELSQERIPEEALKVEKMEVVEEATKEDQTAEERIRTPVEVVEA